MEETHSINSFKLSWTPQKGGDPVLKDVTLELEPGHIYGIIGPNGAGKSSFLKHVLAFLRGDQEGAVRLGEKPVTSYRRRNLARLLSFVPQQTDIDTDFTAQEVVMTGRTPYQKRWEPESRQDREIVEEAMFLTGSRELSERPFFQLSGGEAQKVIIARAVAQATEWMLLDEPIASLDIRNQLEILETLRMLNRQRNVSVLMVLHDVNLAGSYCDRLIMLKHGQVQCAGSTEDCLTGDNLRELYGIEFTCLTGEDGHRYYLASQPPSTAKVNPLT